jgi:hypothetical protein
MGKKEKSGMPLFAQPKSGMPLGLKLQCIYIYTLYENIFQVLYLSCIFSGHSKNMLNSMVICMNFMIQV